MKRTFGFLILIATVALGVGSSVMAQMNHEPHHQEMTAEKDDVVCPVTNKVMRKAEAPVSYTLYFASEAAKDTFIKDPAKFLTTTCPVMGGEANKLSSPYSNYDGVAYFHCCAGCVEQFKKDPKKYIGQMSGSKGHGNSEMKTMEATGHTCSHSAHSTSSEGHTCSGHGKAGTLSSSVMQVDATMAIDPVCGMKVSSKDGMNAKYSDTDYHFCSEQCKMKFEKDPEKYTKE